MSVSAGQFDDLGFDPSGLCRSLEVSCVQDKWGIPGHLSAGGEVKVELIIHRSKLSLNMSCS